MTPKNLLLALLCLGVTAGCTPSYMGQMRAGVLGYDRSEGVDHGDPSEIRRLYRNREYQKAVDGATHFLHTAPLRYNRQWWHYRSVLMMRAESHLGLGQFEDAKRDLDTMVNTAPDDLRKLYGYLAIISLLQGGDLEQALAILDRGKGELDFRNRPRPYGMYFYYRGICNLVGGDFDEARAMFSKSKELLAEEPGADDSSAEIIDAFVQAMDEEGDAAQEKLAQLAPTSVDTYLRTAPLFVADFAAFDPFIVDLVRSSIEKQNYELNVAGVEKLDRMLAERRYEEALRYLGNAYRSTPREKVVQNLGRVLAIHNPGDIAEASRRHLARANRHLEKREYEQAIRSYRQVIGGSPWVFDAYYNLAHIYAADRRFGRAIATMRHYLILQPDARRSRKAQDTIYEWEIEGEQALSAEASGPSSVLEAALINALR